MKNGILYQIRRSLVWAGFASLFIIFCHIPVVVAADTTILMLGDSLTAGYGVEKDQAFPALVESRLQAMNFSGIKVINAGFSGSTTASAYSRLRWYLRIKPDILVLSLGGNDGLRGLGLKSVEKNLAATIELAQKQGMVVLLGGMKMPPNYGDAYTLGFEAVFPALAKQYNIALIPFLLDKVAGEVDLNIADGIHPNPAGHRIVAGTVVKHLLPILKANRASATKVQ